MSQSSARSSANLRAASSIAVTAARGDSVSVPPQPERSIKAVNRALTVNDPGPVFSGSLSCKRIWPSMSVGGSEVLEFFKAIEDDLDWAPDLRQISFLQHYEALSVR